MARALSTVFGLLMLGSAAVGARPSAHAPAVAASTAAVLMGAALISVGVGAVFRSAATLAVVMSVAAIAVIDPAPMFVAISGLCAAAYLVCRHAVGVPAGLLIGSLPTIVAAAGFAFVGLVATSFPLRLPWLPLVAPLGVLGIYLLATRPFLK